MNTEEKNTAELKERFFAHYYDQQVFCWKGDTSSHKYLLVLSITLDKMNKDSSSTKYYLELTPLSMISDEDMWEVGKLYFGKGGGLRQELDLYVSNANVTDYLRSKGYAVPFMGISVEDQIQFGWIKLRDINN